MMLSLESIGLLLGGIGLFLLGMDLMTDGLRLAAGDALVRGMKSLTGNTIKAILSGALVTAIVQSSSATTLMTIGLVSAGVLSFQSSVGVIFGANVGTTMTSWLVSLVGLKFKISAFAYPFVGLGALFRVVAKGRWRHVGAAIAGFGLLFVGIDLLQSGMADVANVIDTEALNPETFWGRTALVLVGVVMTVVMQSSSAAVASTLAALDSGAITSAAAAALVIGQNIGTTVTAAIGAIGATIPAKRTAVAHVGFNIVAGTVAFATFPLFEGAVIKMAEQAGATNPTTQIAAFHTAFNVLGLLILLPLFDQFSRLVEKIVPGLPRKYTSGLDDSVLGVPAVAILAVHDALGNILKGACELCETALHKGLHEDAVVALDEELSRARNFLLAITSNPSQKEVHRQHVDTLHALDHIDRLIRVVVKPSFYEQASEAGEAQSFRSSMLEAMEHFRRAETLDETLVDTLRADSRSLANRRAMFRANMLDQAAHAGAHEPEELTEQLRFIVRVDRVLYHLWRATAHLVGTEDAAALHTHDAPDNDPSNDVG
jgi:phosphate:Na+ symporter